MKQTNPQSNPLDNAVGQILSRKSQQSRTLTSKVARLKSRLSNPISPPIRFNASGFAIPDLQGEPVRMDEGGIVGPKEAAGVYDPSPYTPPQEPEQDHGGMVVAPTFEGNPRDSVTAEFDGVTYIIPTLIDGKRLTNQEAIQNFRNNHQHLGGFDSLEDANLFRSTAYQGGF